MMSRLEFEERLSAEGFLEVIGILRCRPSIPDFDSLLLMEIITTVETWGVPFRDEWLPDIQDLDDLYYYYGESQSEGRTPTIDGLNGGPLVGRTVRLRPVLSQDIERLYVLAQHPELSSTWRFRSSTPSPSEFVDALWDRVAVQFVVSTLRSPEPLGLVTLFNCNMLSGHAEAALLVTPDTEVVGAAREAMILFLDYCFGRFPLRKIFGDIVEPAAQRFGLLRHPVVRVEGRRARHEWFEGSHVDLICAAVWADEWREYRSGNLRYT